MKKEKIRLSALLKVMAACVAVIFGIDCGVRMLWQRDLPAIVEEDGNFLPVGGTKKAPPTLVSGTEDELPTSPGGAVEPGCTTRTVTKGDIFKGRLVPYRGNAEVVLDTSESRVNLAQYKNDYYTTLGEDLPLNKDAADGFNEMMEAYTLATTLGDFAVYGTEVTITGPGSPCPIPFSESKTGNTVDLAVMGCGSVLAYDGLDVQKWVVDNCSNYGML